MKHVTNVPETHVTRVLHGRGCFDIGSTVEDIASLASGLELWNFKLSPRTTSRKAHIYMCMVCLPNHSHYVMSYHMRYFLCINSLLLQARGDGEEGGGGGGQLSMDARPDLNSNRMVLNFADF